MLQKKKVAATAGGFILAGVLIGSATAFAAGGWNPDKGAWEGGVQVEAGQTQVTGVLEEDGTTRPATQEELDQFLQEVEGEDGISPNGTLFLSPGSNTDMPLVIDEDGSVREMTPEEFDALGELEYEGSAVPGSWNEEEGSFGG